MNQPIFKVPGEAKMNEQAGKTEVEITNIPLVEFWGCGGLQYVKIFPQSRGVNQISHIQGASTMGEVSRSIPKINDALEGH